MMTPKEIQATIGKLTETSKMPGFSYGIPAWHCQIGMALNRNNPNSVCSMCYALGGKYTELVVKAAMEHRYNLLPWPIKGAAWRDRWIEAMSLAIGASAFRKKSRSVFPPTPFFRWHDSGDIQARTGKGESSWHLEAIAEVCRRTPQIKHWLPTKEYGQVRAFLDAGNIIPPNLVIRLSEYQIGLGLTPGSWQELLLIPGITVSTVTPNKKATRYLAPSFKKIKPWHRWHVTDPKEAYLPWYLEHRRHLDREVSSTPSSLGGKIYPCPAWKNVGTCGKCRACWNRDVKQVSYPKH